MAGAKGASRKLATGVYEDAISLFYQLMVNGRRVEKHFPKGTTLAAVKAARSAERERLRAKTQTAGVGTLQADVDRYLATVRTMPSYKTRVIELRRWIEELGAERRRDTLTATELDVIMQKWLAAGHAPVTVRHRRTALGRLIAVLDGKLALNVVRGTTRPADPPVEARGVAPDLVRQILARVDDSPMRPRLALLAYAALTPRLLGQITRGDVDFDAAMVRVPGRYKGRGAPGGWRSLLPAAVEAFRDLDRRAAWGPFSVRQWHRDFRKAVRRVNAARQREGLPALPAMRPYDLRHSFASALYADCRDLDTVRRALMHTTTVMTQRYAMTANQAVDAVALARLSRVYGAVNPAVKTSKTQAGLRPLRPVTAGRDMQKAQ